MASTCTDGAGGICYSPLPKLNLELLQDCVAWVQHNNELDGDQPIWNQHSWTEWLPKGAAQFFSQRADSDTYCGSAFCVAGYAVYTSGGCRYPNELVRDGITNITTAFAGPKSPVIDPGLVGYDGDLVAPDATLWGQIGWETAGQAMLGLTSFEASRLFHGGNSASQVVAIANSIAMSRGYESLWPSEESA